MIEFLLDGNLNSVNDMCPETTLLNYLRECLQRKGTKEGCASGDCGACTVVIAEDKDDTLEYRAINSCITLLGTIHGKQLLTIENLKSNGNLHPCQAAMVKCHGSQCGFCTPGIVMSLFAHKKQHQSPDKSEIVESLGGNLCRCTGYRPIIQAGINMYDDKPSDQFDLEERKTLTKLKSISHDQTELKFEGRIFAAPTNVQYLADTLLRNPKARLLAGSTDLGLEITQGLIEPQSLIYLGQIASMRSITVTDQIIRVGAAAKLSEVAPILIDHWPNLRELFERFGSSQIRNQATLGGNIANASPIGDTPPMLLALDAKLLLRRGDQTRFLPLCDFYHSYKNTDLASSEFIEAIDIPRGNKDYNVSVNKVSKRLEDDISTVCLATRWRNQGGKFADVRIALGGMDEIPRRSKSCESILEGGAFSGQTINEAILALKNDFNPIGDVRANADYRKKVAGNLLWRSFLSQSEKRSSLRVPRYA